MVSYNLKSQLKTCQSQPTCTEKYLTRDQAL